MEQLIDTRKWLPARVASMVARIEPVGSRVTCDPPPTDTDEDHLVLLDGGDRWAEFRDAMVGQGWDAGQGDGDDDEPEFYIDNDTQFRSLRRDELNLIVTARPDFFDRFMAATHVARRLNLLDKADRVMLFQAVLYGRCWTPAGGVS